MWISPREGKDGNLSRGTVTWLLYSLLHRRIHVAVVKKVLQQQKVKKVPTNSSHMSLQLSDSLNLGRVH